MIHWYYIFDEYYIQFCLNKKMDCDWPRLASWVQLGPVVSLITAPLAMWSGLWLLLTELNWKCRQIKEFFPVADFWKFQNWLSSVEFSLALWSEQKLQTTSRDPVLRNGPIDVRGKYTYYQRAGFMTDHGGLRKRKQLLISLCLFINKTISK